MEQYTISLKTEELNDVYHYINKYIKENKIRTFRSKMRNFMLYICQFNFWIQKMDYYSGECKNFYVANINPYYIGNKVYINQNLEIIIKYSTYYEYNIPKHVGNRFIFHYTNEKICIIKHDNLCKINPNNPFEWFMSIRPRCFACATPPKSRSIFCEKCSQYFFEIIGKSIIVHAKVIYMLFPACQNITKELITIYNMHSCQRGVIHAYPFLVV